MMRESGGKRVSSAMNGENLLLVIIAELPCPGTNLLSLFFSSQYVQRLHVIIIFEGDSGIQFKGLFIGIYGLTVPFQLRENDSQPGISSWCRATVNCTRKSVERLIIVP